LFETKSHFTFLLSTLKYINSINLSLSGKDRLNGSHYTRRAY
jgi:hypothetical protein